MPPSILFITLDSCRYDAFVEARAPNLKSLAPLHRAQAPSHFTYGSHAAFFMGFTPGDARRKEPYVNPKYGKIFRMQGGGHPGAAPAYLTLDGHSVIDGLKQSGYRAIGTGAVNWFNPERPTGRVLSADFDTFAFPDGPHSSFSTSPKPTCPIPTSGRHGIRATTRRQPSARTTTPPNAAGVKSHAWSGATMCSSRSSRASPATRSSFAPTMATAGAKTASGSTGCRTRRRSTCRCCFASLPPAEGESSWLRLETGKCWAGRADAKAR